MGAPHTEEPLASPHPQDPDARPSLTDRELVVLQLLARGYSLSQCAQLTAATGTETLAAAKAAALKLGVRDSSAAVWEACRLGLVA